jgi:hypothetical protein
MVSMLSSSVVDCGSEPWSGQIKDCKIGICCFSPIHMALSSKSIDWSPREGLGSHYQFIPVTFLCLNTQARTWISSIICCGPFLCSVT